MHRHAIEVIDLEHGGTQHRAGGWCDGLDGALAGTSDQGVEPRLPAEGARHDLGCQRAIATIIETGAHPRHGVGKVAAAGPEVDQRRDGCPPRGRNHGAPGGVDASTVPAARRRPATKAVAGIGRLPSGWTSVISTT